MTRVMKNGFNLTSDDKCIIPIKVNQQINFDADNDENSDGFPLTDHFNFYINRTCILL